jgi:hypothetical protein|tara:strand:- start:1885 stop:2208 length:324 start_codon:yes stop_codon:yes gene_type:complete
MMSINDFQYAADLSDATPEEAATLTRSFSEAMAKRRTAMDSFNDMADSANAFGYELGVLDERTRFENILDEFGASLLPSEEDAKVAIEILRKMISSGSTEEESNGED